jgi:hypothetical protein
VHDTFFRNYPSQENGFLHPLLPFNIGYAQRKVTYNIGQTKLCMKLGAFWDIAPCSLGVDNNPDDGGSMHL